MPIYAPDILPYIYATGNGDIAHTFQKGNNRPFVLSTLEVHFVGGTGTADLTISRDSEHGSAYDTSMITVEGAGTTGDDVALFVTDNEIYRRYLFDVYSGSVDTLRIDWTNPDAGNMVWGIVLGLAYATQS